MKSDEIEVGGKGMKAVVRTNSSPAFPLCIILFLVGVQSVFSGENKLFFITGIVILAVFIGLLIFKPQNLMDSKMLFEWTKAFFGDKDNPVTIEGDIVKTETISAKASITKKK